MRFPDDVPVLTAGPVGTDAGDGGLAPRRVAGACGFTETGRDRRVCDRPYGSVVDLIHFDPLRSEWVAEQRAETAP
jgi:hypothetical protein